MRAVLMIAVLAVAVPDRPDPAPKEKAKPLQEQVLGEWKLVQSTRGGMEENIPAGSFMVFTPAELRFHQTGRQEPDDVASYHLDADKKPPAIDIVLKCDPAKKIEGILKIEGNTLVMCAPQNGEGKRPTDFVSPANSHVALLRFERIKK